MAEKYGKKVREIMVKEIEESLDKKGFIFSGYDKIKSSEIDKFRKKVKRAGSSYFIVKKRLGKRAIDSMGLSGLNDVFEAQKHVGMVAIEDDPVSIAKILVDFSKENANFEISSGYLEGRVIGADKVKELSNLPGRQQLLAMVAGTLNAPITGFVGTLASVVRSICNVLNAVKDKKESGK